MDANANGSLVVTLVEDEPSIGMMMARALTLWKQPFQQGASAEEGLALMLDHPTPLLLTDLRMPGQGGLWLVREVRRRWPHTMVVVLTGAHDTDAVVECLNAGAFQYLFKPVNLEQLRRVLETALETYRLREERALYQQHLEETVRAQTQHIRSLFLSAIDSLIRALEARDPYTSGHSVRVRRGAVALARALGLGRKEVRQISLAAALHDIGKVAVPEAVLNKPGALTEEEWRVIRAHPVVGEQILRPVIRSRAILGAIRGHHERLDGHGYPDGLSGEGIPLLARVLSVADYFDAVTSARPYRQPLTLAEGADLLRQVAGAHLEPRFVEVFLRDVIHHWDRPDPRPAGRPAPALSQMGLAKVPRPIPPGAAG